VHDAKVDDGGEAFVSKDFLGFFAANVDLVMNDVVRFVLERATIDADDGAFDEESASESSSEPSADSGDENREVGMVLAVFARRVVGGSGCHGFPHSAKNGATLGGGSSSILRERVDWTYEAWVQAIARMST